MENLWNQIKSFYMYAAVVVLASLDKGEEITSWDVQILMACWMIRNFYDTATTEPRGCLNLMWGIMSFNLR